MPIVVSNEGWVKVPAPKRKAPPKPADPVGVLRGPLAYITGRPQFREPVKKQSIRQLLIEAAPPPPPSVVRNRPQSQQSRDRVASAPVSTWSKHKAATEIFEEADEEITRPGLRPEDSQSRRSASPAASRHPRAAPSIRSRRHEMTRSVYDEDQENYRHNKSIRHAAHPVYYDDRKQYHRNGRSDRSEREYRDYRGTEGYYPNNYAPQMPQIQPIIIYSTPPPAAGCGAHHGCVSYQQQYHAPRPLITAPLAAAPGPAMLSAPRPPPSEVSSRSSGSTQSRAMSYKWYTATQPLKI